MKKRTSTAARPRPASKRPRRNPRGGRAGLPRYPKWPWPPKPLRPLRLPRSPFARFLARHPRLAAAIVWRAPGPVEQINGVPIAYPAWINDWKAQLARTWTRIRGGTFAGLPAAPAVSLVLNNAGDIFSTSLTPATAWDYFLAHVAQSLAVESERRVPWSLDDHPAADLVWLFDSKSLFHFSSTINRYFTPKAHGSVESLGAAQPGDPPRTFEALQSRGLIGASRRETIDRVLDWARSNLVHFYGFETPTNVADYWQYSGWPPVERVLAGTTHPQFGFAHWTAGCWGTAGFLRHLLRTVNLPASIEPRDGHALPRFHLPPVSRGRSGHLFLSHGDDPYNSLWRATPPVPIGELTLNARTFGRWFGAAAVPPPSGSNVGRQTVELAIRHLSDPLLRAHCDDLAAGRSHAQSRVYDPQVSGLGKYYTVLELEGMQLWDRLDARLAAIGGCANVPP
jgi:hypothetical protein